MKVDVEGLQEWFNFGKFHFTAQENNLCPQPLGKKLLLKVQPVHNPPTRQKKRVI